MSDPQSATHEADVWPQFDDPDSEDASQDGMPLGFYIADFFRSIWMRRKFVLIVVFAGIVLSLIYALKQPNIYMSTTTLLPPDDSSSYTGLMSMLSGAGPAASLGSSELGIAGPAQLYVTILGSRNVQNAVVADLNLKKYFEARDAEMARRILAGEVSAEEDRKSGIITVSVRDVNPQMAASIAQTYVTELNRVLNDDTTSSARRERIFLEGRVKDIKQQLDDTAQALSEFSRKNQTVDAVSQAKSMMDAGIRLQSELIDARGQLAALRQVYSEDNSRVKAADARISELQREIVAMGGGSDAKASSPGGSGYPSAGQLSVLGVPYYDLQRKMLVEEAIWEALTKQYEAAKVDEAKEIPTVRVLDVANVPQSKTGPIRSMIMMVGTLCSFVLACLLVVAIKFWDQIDPDQEPKKLLTEIAGGLNIFRKRS
jgi:uncharacterized protein involved in exopolysaccharide biosynthesis